ncbi:hypothetical protein DPMN_174884 [Dreissena polymorpha]|uniref:Uncharacterized protein n=1 Tax=Dreissena polymorpha TaxID=45954 RepID=A0A9D4E8B1_DREPO|nr:hypothetical protein DPMN_174884 [Dreissena polymorpha]
MLRTNALRKLLLNKTFKDRVCVVAVDEAHCVSEWEGANTSDRKSRNRECPQFHKCSDVGPHCDHNRIGTRNIFYLPMIRSLLPKYQTAGMNREDLPSRSPCEDLLCGICECSLCTCCNVYWKKCQCAGKMSCIKRVLL